MEKFFLEETLDQLTLEFIGKSPILAIGAMFFSQDRQHAFWLCYKSMRIADDKVDDVKEKNNGAVPIYLRSTIERRLRLWVKSVKDDKPTNDDQRRLIDLLVKMDLPIWPWEKLVDSMVYDLSHNGFETFPIFLNYTEGAAVSPGSIFMHLCGAKNEDGKYKKPTFDIMEAARPLARFSYLVHIMRDFRKDQNSSLNYFPDDLMAEYGLTIPLLRKMAKEGLVTDDFRKFIKRYQKLAEGYKFESRQMLDRVGGEMQLRYLLSLEVLFSLYTQIFERTFKDGCNFTTEEMNPSPIEIKSRIVEVVSRFDKK